MELEELLTRKLQFCEYLESWGLDESSRRIAMLYDELARLRAENDALRSEVERSGRIEDACAPVVSDPLVSAKSVRNLRAIIEANPRPETAP
jgi:uncharacterized small protein (DUF1192 family)